MLLGSWISLFCHIIYSRILSQDWGFPVCIWPVRYRVLTGFVPLRVQMERENNVACIILASHCVMLFPFGTEIRKNTINNINNMAVSSFHW